MCYFFLFFKQKTAYEMRISDWSSDVCSSDLVDFLACDLEHRTRVLSSGTGGAVTSLAAIGTYGSTTCQSGSGSVLRSTAAPLPPVRRPDAPCAPPWPHMPPGHAGTVSRGPSAAPGAAGGRSEEHTAELPS